MNYLFKDKFQECNFAFSFKTTARVISPYGRSYGLAVTYYLGLNKNFLISSLNSVTSTAITAMERFMSSIMDSLNNEILPHTQLNS
ncbi:hypothetical protein, partial [Campylobacter fetus]|uniref:hypothetical protein n=1 Tax=Campylobacter fetus TaxID=196 RepID=UPI00082848E1